MIKKSNLENNQKDIFAKHKFGSEVLIGLIIFGLGMFFMVPFYSTTTAPLQLVLLGLFMLAILVFVITHYKNLKSHQSQKQLPLIERFVYISIVAVLSLAIVIQFFSGTLDIWLVFILIFVVLFKIFLLARYSDN